MRENKLLWFGHVTMRDEARGNKMNVKGKRGRRKEKKRYIDGIESDVRVIEQDVGDQAL